MSDTNTDTILKLVADGKAKEAQALVDALRDASAENERTWVIASSERQHADAAKAGALAALESLRVERDEISIRDAVVAGREHAVEQRERAADQRDALWRNTQALMRTSFSTMQELCK